MGNIECVHTGKSGYIKAVTVTANGLVNRAITEFVKFPLKLSFETGSFKGNRMFHTAVNWVFKIPQWSNVVVCRQASGLHNFECHTIYCDGKVQSKIVTHFLVDCAGILKLQLA